MKIIYPLFLLLLLLAQSSKGQIYQEVNVHLSKDQLKTIGSLGIPAEEGCYKDGKWRSILLSTDVEKIRNAGFTVDVIREDYKAYIKERNKSEVNEIKKINRMIRQGSFGKDTSGAQSPTHNPQPPAPIPSTYTIPQHFELGSMGGFYTPDEVLNELDSMYIFYPNLVTPKAQSGNLPTVEGRTIYYVKITSNPGQSSNKPKIFYNSLIHAREPMGMQQLFFFMWYLLENYATNPEIKYLVDNLELYFIPVENPDGYAYNYSTDPGGGGLWRKNRKLNSDGTYGVDLNRNFGFQWGYDNNGSSPIPGDETYRGPTPFSEPETQDFRDFSIDRKFRFSYDYHTFSDLTMYPWSYISDLTADSVLETSYTDYMTAGNGYITGTPGHVLYNTNGSSIDWQYGEQSLKPKTIAFTTEIGNDGDGFWPSVSRIIPLAQENLLSNIMVAHLTLPYPKITDIGPVISPAKTGYFPFEFRRIGLKDSTDFTVKIRPLDSALFTSVGSQKTFHYPVQFTSYADSISYSLISGIQVGQAYRIIYETSNGMYTFRDTVTKYFGWPMVLFSDDCSNLNNWTSNKWNTTTMFSHSPPRSITDSPFGNYNNYSNYFVTQKNPLSLQTSPVTVIEFWIRHNIEKSFDYAQFSVSLNNGGSYTKTATRFTNSGSSGQDYPNPVFDGNRWDFSHDRVVLTNTSGKQLLSRFLMHSDGGVTADGVYFDDFSVTIIDMDGNGIAPAAEVNGYISNPIPNPATDAVSINYQLPQSSSQLPAPSTQYLFRLFDSRGIVLKEIPLSSSEGRLRFNVSDLASGIYFYKISGEFGSTGVRKLIVTK